MTTIFHGFFYNLLVLFLLFFCLSLSLRAQKSNSIKLSYLPKADAVNKVVALVSYSYENAYGWFEYKCLSKADSHYVVSLSIPEEVLNVQVYYYEFPQNSSHSNQLNSTNGVMMVSSLPPAHKELIRCSKAPLTPQELIFNCSNQDIVAYETNKELFSAIGIGNLFVCLYRKHFETNPDSISFYFEKYGEAALLELEADTGNRSLTYLSALTALCIIARNKSKSQDCLRLIRELYPNSIAFFYLPALYKSFFNEEYGEVELWDFVRKYPTSAFADFVSSSPFLQARNIKIEDALFTLNYFADYYNLPKWYKYEKITNLLFAYNQKDSAYYRKKELVKAIERGDICYNSTMLDSTTILQHYSDIAEYEFANNDFFQAKNSIRPVYYFYNKNYSQLSFLASNINFTANLLAQTHLALNEKDSALHIYTELAKLTQVDSIFDKIKATYHEIHGSDSGYREYLAKNSIDKFYKEKKYAPEVSFRLYGTDASISISSLKGKVVVLNFWGTYCKPCIKEMPELNNIKTKFSQEKDVIFIAPTKDNAAKLKSFFKSKKFDYLIAYAAEDVFKAFNVSFIPVNIVINRNGEIIFEEAGVYKDTHLKLNRAIEEALYAR
jgi:thiol-disulfide isomerase/thioredoxin